MYFLKYSDKMDTQQTHSREENIVANMSPDMIIKNVTEICRACGVEHLSLFGSYAAGTQTPYSDIDFIVYGAADIETLREKTDEIPTLIKIDLFEYEMCENDFLKEDMDLYAKKIY